MPNLNIWKISGHKKSENIDLIVGMDTRFSKEDVLNYFKKLLNIENEELSVKLLNTVHWNF
jgi:hypothetical protein